METVSTIPSVYPTGTCSTCREITLDSLVGVFKAPDFDWQWLNLVYPQIELTSQECAVCGIVIQLLENRGDNVGGAVMVSLSTHTGQMNTSSQDNIMEVRVRHAAGNGFTTRPGWAHFRMYADAGSPASRHFSKSPLPGKESPATMAWVEQQIAHCDGSHEKCKRGLSGEKYTTNTTLPTRLVYVGTTDSPVLRLVEPGRDEKGQYVTLSHCWGGKDVITTTVHNIQEHKRSIPPERLQKTFTEAIEITRQLGVPFIWVDSLCIFQGRDSESRADWARESARMGEIYERSYLTIAATSSSDGDGGLFADGRPNYVEYPCGPTADSGKMYMALPTATEPVQDLNHGPLSNRGWVLQERILSRRTLHFGSAQVYWECRTHILSQSDEFREDMNAVLQWAQLDWCLNDWELETNAPFQEELRYPLRQIDIKHPLIVPRPSEEERNDGVHPMDTEHHTFHALWAGIVSYYSSRRLSETNDRLVALSGIRERVQARTGFPFPHGHCADTKLCFVKSLAWVVSREHSPPSNDADRRALARGVPTWATIAFEQSIFYPSGTLLHLDWSTVGLEDYGLHVRSTLDDNSKAVDVSGILMRATRGPHLPQGYGEDGEYYFFSVSASDSTTTDVGEKMEKYIVKTDTGQVPVGWVGFDSKTYECDSFICCPLYVSVEAIPCLVLRELEGGAGRRFERIGLTVLCGRWHMPEEQQRVNRELHEGLVKWLGTSSREDFQIV